MSSRDIYSATDHDESPCHYRTAADGRSEDCHAECFDYPLWKIVQEERRKERQRATDRLAADRLAADRLAKTEKIIWELSPRERETVEWLNRGKRMEGI